MKMPENPWFTYFSQYFYHGIASSEGLTKGPPDFNVLCLIRRHTEKRGGEVYSELWHSELMWADVGYAFLREGGQSKSVKDTMRGNFKRWGFLEEGRTQDTVVRPVQQAAPGSGSLWAAGWLKPGPMGSGQMLLCSSDGDASCEPTFHQWSHCEQHRF